MVVWNFKIYNIFNNVVELFSFSHLLSVNIVLVRINYSSFASGNERVSTRLLREKQSIHLVQV